MPYPAKKYGAQPLALEFPDFGNLIAPKTTKPGWFARLSFRGTGSVNLVSIADPECQSSLAIRGRATF
jgi:hypothetical protein